MVLNNCKVELTVSPLYPGAPGKPRKQKRLRLLVEYLSACVFLQNFLSPIGSVKQGLPSEIRLHLSFREVARSVHPRAGIAHRTEAAFYWCGRYQIWL